MNKAYSTRLNEEEVKQIDEAAKSVRQSRAQFIAYAAIKRASEIIE